MEITWYGQACFKIKGKGSSVVIDPFDPQFTGLKEPKDLQADILLITHGHEDHNFKSLVKGTVQATPQTFEVPGEYEVNGVIVTGITSFHDNHQGDQRGKNTIFHIMIDNLSIVHLGDIGQYSLSESQVSAIDQTDILLIPVGSVYTIAAKEAANIVSQLEPKIIIPMHYRIDRLKFELDSVDNFLKEMGAEGIEPQPKLVTTKEKLPEEPQVVVLKPI